MADICGSNRMGAPYNDEELQQMSRWPDRMFFVVDVDMVRGALARWP